MSHKHCGRYCCTQLAVCSAEAIVQIISFRIIITSEEEIAHCHFLHLHGLGATLHRFQLGPPWCIDGCWPTARPTFASTQNMKHWSMEKWPPAHCCCSSWRIEISVGEGIFEVYLPLMVTVVHIASTSLNTSLCCYSQFLAESFANSQHQWQWQWRRCWGTAFHVLT